MQVLLLAIALSTFPQAASLPTLSANAITRAVAPLEAGERLGFLAYVRENGVIERMSDEQVTALLSSVGYDALLKNMRRFLEVNPTFEARLLKLERFEKELPEQPDRMHLRYREAPQAIYVRWLEGGPNAGQEIIFDAEKDADRLYAHAGGWLNIKNVWIARDSSIARRRTNHDVSELGFMTFVRIMEKDRRTLEENGLPWTPVKEGIVRYDKKRYWESEFVTPGPPAYYAARTRFLFDLATGMPRLIEIFDADSKLLERYDYTSVTWGALPDNAFDPDNPEYDF